MNDDMFDLFSDEEILDAELWVKLMIIEYNFYQLQQNQKALNDLEDKLRHAKR